MSVKTRQRGWNSWDKGGAYCCFLKERTDELKKQTNRKNGLSRQAISSAKAGTL